MLKCIQILIFYSKKLFIEIDADTGCANIDVCFLSKGQIEGLVACHLGIKNNPLVCFFLNIIFCLKIFF